MVKHIRLASTWSLPMATIVEYKHLERDPKSVYQQLSIKGRRIKARTLYGSFMSEAEPMTVEEIAADYGLPVEAVKEAIAYCQSDPPEIREDYERDELLMEASGMNDPNYKHLPHPKLLPAEEIHRINRS
jgi:uncharacterized protein (DUF433 family)